MPYKPSSGKDNVQRSGPRRRMRVSRQERDRQKKVVLAGILFFAMGVGLLLLLIYVKIERPPETVEDRIIRNNIRQAVGGVE